MQQPLEVNDKQVGLVVDTEAPTAHFQYILYHMNDVKADREYLKQTTRFTRCKLTKYKNALPAKSISLFKFKIANYWILPQF